MLLSCLCLPHTCAWLDFPRFSLPVTSLPCPAMCTPCSALPSLGSPRPCLALSFPWIAMSLPCLALAMHTNHLPCLSFHVHALPSLPYSVHSRPPFQAISKPDRREGKAAPFHLGTTTKFWNCYKLKTVCNLLVAFHGCNHGLTFHWNIPLSSLCLNSWQCLNWSLSFF